MDHYFVVDLLRQGIYVGIIMVTVIILPSLVVGLIIAMFQAATQINEQTLSFLPRFIVTMLALSVAGNWLGGMVYDYFMDIVHHLPQWLS